MRLVIAALVTSVFITVSPAKAADERGMLELSGDYTIDVSINGQPFKLAVDPDIGASRVLNADAAQKLGLEGSMIGGRHMVGPVELSANSNVLNYNFGKVQDKKRTFWFKDRPASTKADGMVSAAALPYKSVRFVLRQPAEGERAYTLPLSEQGANALLTVHGVEVALGFNLNRDATIATASTGVLLSEAYNGGFSGPAVATMIRFGVDRPTRPILLKQPMDIGGLQLTNLLVRVSDFGDATQIKDADGPDSDEIVVTATSKRKPRYQMALGRDFLSRCSTLTFDYRVRQVQMMCRL